MKIPQAITLVLTVLVCVASQTGALACPFCSAVSQTLSQEIAGADAAVIARLIKLPSEADSNSELDLDDPDSGTAEFEVLEVVRSKDLADKAPAKGDTIKVVYFGNKDQKEFFLINGIAGKRIDWTTPQPLTEQSIEYIKALDTLPEKGAARLAFFLDYLEHEDPLLAQDAYDEFGRAPYDEVEAVGDQIDRPQLLDWIEDSEVGPTRRRLYLTMLGICGKDEDIAFLESLLRYDYKLMKPGLAATQALMRQAGPAFGTTVLNEMIKADVRRKQQCLDALVAAYLKLKGPAGLPLIEERFLANPAVEYTHIYAAVMALRFHGEETDSLPRERLLQSVRMVLNNPDIADQVIPDLARWDDWSVLDRLVTMFKDSEENAWVRQPVISYLLAATDQPPEISDRAKAAIEELEELDPQGVKRAKSYMAFGLLARTGGKKKGEEKTAAKTNDKKANKTVTVAKPQIKSVPIEKPAEAVPAAAADLAATPVASPESPSETSTPEGPSRMMIIGGPIIAGLVLFGIFALLLRGADVRSSDS